MPRNVRNFWVTVDAGHTSVSTGPRSAQDGIDITIQVRELGGVGGAVHIVGRRFNEALEVTAVDLYGKRTVLAQVAR